jgi:hypothetical protein
LQLHQSCPHLNRVFSHTGTAEDPGDLDELDRNLSRVHIGDLDDVSFSKRRRNARRR